MGLENIKELSNSAELIRQETLEGMNSAERVGGLFVRLITCINNSLSTEEGIRESSDNRIIGQYQAAIENNKNALEKVLALQKEFILLQELVNSKANNSEIQNLISGLRNDLDLLDHDNATNAIESFREILAFLDGIKDDETLLAKLAEIKGIISDESGARQTADNEIFRKINWLDNRDKHKVINLNENDDIDGPYLTRAVPEEYATLEAALQEVKSNHEVTFGTILTFYNGKKYLRYQFCPKPVRVYTDEGNVESQAIALPQYTDVGNPDSWVRLPDDSDLAKLAELKESAGLEIYNFGALNFDFTDVNWSPVIPQDAICSQIDGIFSAWEAGKKIVGRFVVTKRVQQGNSSSMVTQPFDSFTIDYGGEDSHTHNPSLRFHCVSVDTSDSNIRVRSVRVYFSKYNEGEGFTYMYGASSMSQIDIPSSMNFNDWRTRLTTLETKAPTIEITDDDIVALLPSVEAGISTLELDEAQTVAVDAVNAAHVNEKFEQFRAQLARELERGRKRMQFNNPENTTDNGIEQ